MADMKGVVSAVTQLKSEREHLRRQLQRVDEALSALGSLNGGASRGQRRLSVAARKRIAAAQRARWAKFKARQKQAQ
jgi:hypothetical protein